jgi:creatinine amidohydrolase
MHVNMEYLRPGQILERLAQTPVIFVPIGPLEWHGPHMPYGTDGINAATTAKEVCRRVGGLVWPTLFWGTERERRPEQLQSLGFRKDQYVVGMDFPGLAMPSCYCAEEVLAIVVREVLRAAGKLGAKLIVIVNGHGAENHMAMLQRLATEISNTTGPRVYFRIAIPKEIMDSGSGGHADSDETAMMMHMTDSVDLSALPPLPQKMPFKDFAVVSGGGFDNRVPDHILPEATDPRRHATKALGQKIFETAVQEIEHEVKELLKGLRPEA